MTRRYWRVSSAPDGAFDELVTPLAHLEMMNVTTCDVCDVWLGPVHLTVWRDKAGAIHVRHNEGRILGPYEDKPKPKPKPKPKRKRAKR